MSVSYYDVTVPMFSKNLKNLKAFLQKGVAHAAEMGVSEADFLNSRLSPDMFPLIKQVQIATDNAKGVATRLTGVDPLKIEDTETTLSELCARIDTVLGFLSTFTKEQFADAATKQITLPYFEGKYFTGDTYVVEFAIPNFFFHVSMAYAIIRASGVPLGKGDYLGVLTMLDVA
jgi:uncharacterized protein